MNDLTKYAQNPARSVDHVRSGLFGMATLTLLVSVALAGCSDAESGEDPGSEAMGAPGAAVEESGTASPAPRPMLPAGTVLTFEVTETVSTETANPGDQVRLRLVETVSGAEGARLSAGTAGSAVVTESRESAGAEEQAVLALQVSSVNVDGSQQELNGTIESTETESAARASGARSAGTVATGAAAGAILGQILGGDTRSTTAGAAVGAVAGLGVALSTRDGHAVLHEGSRITVRLDEALLIP